MAKVQYSLWLMPSPASSERFAELIDALSRRLGTPRFEPHITLAASRAVSEAQALAEAKRLATHLAPVPVQFDGIGHTDEYFRCLFLRAVKSNALLAAHRHACTVLAQPVEADYLPHLSLVYGELDRAEKERIVAEIAGRHPEEFIADRISVCALDGTPETWPILGPFPLSGTAV